MTLDHRVARLLSMHPLIDGHNDLPYALRSLTGGAVSEQDLEKLELDRYQPLTRTDLPRSTAGRVGAQFWSVYVPADLPQAAAVVQTLEQIDLVHAMIRRHADRLAFTTTAHGLGTAFRSGRIVGLIGAEGGHAATSSSAILAGMAVRCGWSAEVTGHAREIPAEQQREQQTVDVHYGHDRQSHPRTHHRGCGDAVVSGRAGCRVHACGVRGGRRSGAGDQGERRTHGHQAGRCRPRAQGETHRPGRPPPGQRGTRRSTRPLHRQGRHAHLIAALPENSDLGLSTMARDSVLATITNDANTAAASAGLLIAAVSLHASLDEATVPHRGRTLTARRVAAPDQPELTAGESHGYREGAGGLYGV